MCRRSLRLPGAAPAIILVTATAAYLCVPETDQFKGVALLIIGIAVVEWVSREVLPTAWHAMLLAVVLWAGLTGATERGSAVVGTVFAGWTLVLPALMVTMAGQPHSARRVSRAWVMVAGAAALVVARTGALDRRLAPALQWTCAAAAASALTAWLLSRPGRPPHPPH